MKLKPINNVVYYVPVDQKYFDKWEYYQVDLKMLKDAHKNVLIAKTLKEFIKIIFSKKIDLVYYWWWHSSVVVVLISRLINIPTIGTGAVHMYDESGAADFFKKSYLFRLTNRICWKVSTKVLFISKSQSRQITSHAQVNNHLVLKSSSIHTKKELFENLAGKTPSSKIKLLTVCWMTKDQIVRKSIDKILKAISMMPKNKLDQISLHIIGGSGDGIEYLKKLIIELDLSDLVHLEYDVTDDRKKELYKYSDLYLQPSYYEGFGNSVLEAMTYGTPCVVSCNTAQPEVVKDSGYVINQISSKDIFDAIFDYSCKTFDQKIKMIDDVKKVVIKHHSYDDRLDQYTNLVKGDAK
jgi:glycosyltransferase involved in cell wall biosynthesis|tara:strand:+ start:151 stop:1206 length:1056 start_codon:yes stop_codon:yes gene_type:complete